MNDPSEAPAILPDYIDRAKGRLPPDLLAYFLGTAGQGRTSRANLAAFDSVTLRPRVLQDLRGGSTAVSLFGATLDHPIFVAPFAYQKLLCDTGEPATAAAAQAQGARMILSAQSSTKMSQARDAGDLCDWFQMYWMGTREVTQALLQRALDAGFRAIVLTVDAPVQGVRDAEITAGFRLPRDVGAVNLRDLPPPGFAPLDEGESLLFDRIAHVSMRWPDVAWLCATSPIPVLLKGILCAEDARLAVDHGAAGVIVSNHGGRVLDGAPASLRVLPEVAAAVGAAVPVLMDGGIRRGVDVFAALALGARAVLVGQPVVAGLAVAGSYGVSHVLRLLRDELEVAMALCGCRTLADITPDRVYLTE